MSALQKSKGLNISLWIAQVLLGGMFLMAGITKSTTPVEQLYVSYPWTKEVSEGMVRFIGISELLAAIGLLLPSILRIKPVLTPIAALGLVLIMLLAMGYHIKHAEYAVIGFNLVLGAIAVFIAWGRFKKAPIIAR